VVEKAVRFSETNSGLARIDSKYGVQEVTIKPCQHDGDVFFTMRSGPRMIAFSITFEEFDHIAKIIDDIDKREEVHEIS
jgi:hypothetical protein